MSNIEQGISKAEGIQEKTNVLDLGWYRNLDINEQEGEDQWRIPRMAIRKSKEIKPGSEAECMIWKKG
jgi:hypothetical protein